MVKTDIQDILNTKDQLIQTMLMMASKKSWSDIVLKEIIEKSGVDNDMATALFSNKDALLGAYHTKIDYEMAQDCQGTFTENDDIKDRLFDVFMARFDLINDHRAAMISILNDITMNPAQSFCGLPHVCASVHKICDVANVNADGWCGAAKITALTVLYLKFLRDWVRDDSDDMAATMASLDRGLDLFLRINA